MSDASLDLARRDGLPDDLRFLLARFPRPGWHDHPNFGPVTRFYLDRHAMFRDLSGLIEAELRAILEREGDRRRHLARFARLAQVFLSELHTHHSVEDHHYFPALVRLEPRLARGFDLLDRDHHAIHAAMETFANDANRMLAAAETPDEVPARAMLAGHARFAPLLARHLEDEEEIVIPVMLDRGEAALGL